RRPDRRRQEGRRRSQGRGVRGRSVLRQTTSSHLTREKMSILVDKNTRLICQGITGKAGAFHSHHCRDYGTNLVPAATPGKGGTTAVGGPVFDPCEEAVKATGANATMVFVPPPFAADSILEAADAGIPLIVAITEGIPVEDMARTVAYLKAHHPTVRLI